MWYEGAAGVLPRGGGGASAASGGEEASVGTTAVL